MFRFATLFSSCIASALLLSAAEADLPTSVSATLRNIGEVRSLSRDDAGKGLPVHVRGIVTWRGLRRQMTVQDDTGGTWLLISEDLWTANAESLKAIHVGDKLDIDGVAVQGGYAPVIMATAISVIGEGPLPSARPMDPSRFFNGADAGTRVEVRGVVQGFQPAEQGWTLHVDSNPGHFTIEFPTSVLPNPEVLIDAEIRATGVAVTRVNTRGEITMPRVYSSRADEMVVTKIATPPFSAPLMPLDRLLPFRPEPTGPHRMRVIGTVTYVLPGSFIYLQERQGAVRVELQGKQHFEIGDRVEAAGFVDMHRFIGTLTGAIARKIGQGQLPEAESISPEAIIALNNDALDRGVMTQPHDYDGHLVRFRGTLAALQSATDARQPWRRLLLGRGDMLLSAVLLGGNSTALDHLLPGTLLEVTGIVQLDYSPVLEPRTSLRPTQIEVILRNPADVRVIRAPSWWTARRLLAAVAVVAVAFGAALLWATQLRRQVHRKTEQLALEMQARRNAAIEFQATLRERNRLAANLHDTLLQTLGGIGFQIGAGEAEAALPGRTGKPIAHLAVARRILDHAVQELRSSVWALRSPPLQGRMLPDALQAMAEWESNGKPARIELHAEGDFSHLSEFVAGNLVFAAQEAVRNALKHASPSVITLKAWANHRPGWIAVEVVDDGIGFIPGQEAGANQGHFGLVGMRERIERLDGTLSFESVPGNGTTVRIEVPVRPYDDTVA